MASISSPPRLIHPRAPSLPWSRDDVSWHPLNGQVALPEHCRGDIGTPPEALAVIVQNRAARKHARHKERSLVFIRRNRHKWHVWSKTYFTKVRKARKIACEVCNIWTTSTLNVIQTVAQTSSPTSTPTLSPSLAWSSENWFSGTFGICLAALYLLPSLLVRSDSPVFCNIVFDYY
jgi:hypothetical protein